MVSEIRSAVKEIFDAFGGKDLIKSSGDVRTLQDIDMAGDITSPDSIDLIGDMPEAGSYPTDLFDSFEEVSSILIKKLKRKNVYLSGECNDLCSTAEAMFHLMKVNPIMLVPINPVSALRALITAKLKGSQSRVPNPWSHLLKRV